MNHAEVRRVPLQFSQGCVVASIQIDLTEEVLQQFRQDLLERLYETKAKGLIIDLSGVEVMDYEDFKALNTTLSMASLMGAKTILTGFQPGVVSSLVDFNAEIDHLNATLNLDSAFELMKDLNSTEKYFAEEEVEEKLGDTFGETEENLVKEYLEENGTAKVDLDWS
jgi:rsbT antagonist protein RsbS